MTHVSIQEVKHKWLSTARLMAYKSNEYTRVMVTFLRCNLNYWHSCFCVVFFRTPWKKITLYYLHVWHVNVRLGGRRFCTSRPKNDPIVMRRMECDASAPVLSRQRNKVERGPNLTISELSLTMVFDICYNFMLCLTSLTRVVFS